MSFVPTPAPPPAPSSPDDPPDMSITVGGRTISPAFPVVDASPPSPADRALTSSLRAYMDGHIPVESPAGLRTRERVLSALRGIVRAWIRHVTLVDRRLPREVADGAGGEMYTSGSYRLGVHEPGADIDAIVVSPVHCTREDFFGGLAERIKERPEVANFTSVEGARTPVMTFDMDGINIDLMFARLATPSVPESLDVDDDRIFAGVDSATEKSLNGPRSANLIARFVSGTPERYAAFLTVVRCVRRWAKARGIYSNKMGYWGGINVTIAVAFTLQLYPNVSPAALLRKFFLVFKTWRWPNPVMLCRPHDVPEIGLPVWNGFVSSAGREVAPIITPAYPAMNSTGNVSRQTLQILHSEIVRGHGIVDRIFREEPDDSGAAWNELFEPADFFGSLPHYVGLCVVAPTTRQLQSWALYVESRLRVLVASVLGRSLPLKRIQLWPKGASHGCYADRHAGLTAAQRRNAITYFIGFAIDRPRMRGERLDVERMVQQWAGADLARYAANLPEGESMVGSDVVVKYYRRRVVPKELFEGQSGGKDGSIARYRKRKREDPVRREKVRLRKLEVLKKKVEDMQRRKREREEDAEGALAAAAKLLADEDEEENGGETQPMEEEAPDDDVQQKKDTDAQDGAEDKTADETPNPDVIMSDENPPPKAIDTHVSEETGDLQPTADEKPPDTADPDADGAAPIPETADLPPTADPPPSDDTSDPRDPDADGAAPVPDTGELPPTADPTDGKPSDTDDPDADEAALLLLENALDTMQATSAFVQAVTREEAELDRRRLLEGDLADEPAEEGERAPAPAARAAAALREAGCVVVSEGEETVEEEVPAAEGRVPAWRRRPVTAGEGGGPRDGRRERKPIRIALATKFPGIIELDVNGHVIDKGDDNFRPSTSWTGQKEGFEFKLGARGLGYYRTGVEVVVPSNTSY